MKKASNKLFGAVATVTVFGIFTRILSFIFKIYLSRTLGAQAIGLYQIALSVFYMFATVSASGIPLALSRKTAEDAALDKKQNYSLVSSAIILGLMIAGFLVLTLLLFRNHIDFLFSNEAAVPLFIIMLPALISTTLYCCVRSWFWGRKAFTSFSATETVEEICRILFSVLFLSGVVAGLSGAHAIALAFTVSDFIVAIILLIAFFAKGGRIKKPKDIKAILLPALPVTAMRLFASLMGTLVAILLPARLMLFGMNSAEATASFGRIAGMANPLLLAPNAIIGSLAVVLVPEMSANGIRGEYGKLNKHLNNSINFAFIISGLFMLVFVALGEKLTLLLYDDAISGQYLQFAAYLMLPMCLSQLTQSAINAIGKEMRSFVNYVIGNIFMLAAILILPKYIGIYAVAVASMLSLTVTSILNVYTLKKYTNFDCHFIKYLVTVLLFIFPAAFFAESLFNIFEGGLGLFSIFPAAILSVAAYALLCFTTELVDVKGFVKLRYGK